MRVLSGEGDKKGVSFKLEGEQLIRGWCQGLPSWDVPQPLSYLGDEQEIPSQLLRGAKEREGACPK